MDARIERTRRSLQEALLALARERPLDSITVADIAARAGVNRSSFYQHFTDKDTLLADALESAADEARAALPDLAEPLAAPPRAMLAYFQHIEANASLYRLVLGDHGSAVVAARLRARIGHIVRSALDSVPTENIPGFTGMPIDVVGAALTGSILGVIEAWLGRDPRPAADVAVDWAWHSLNMPNRLVNEARPLR